MLTMRSCHGVFASLALAVSLPACSQGNPLDQFERETAISQQAVALANTVMLDAAGVLVARVSFTEHLVGTRVRISGLGLSTGIHAFHVHATRIRRTATAASARPLRPPMGTSTPPACRTQITPGTCRCVFQPRTSELPGRCRRSALRTSSRVTSRPTKSRGRQSSCMRWRTTAPTFPLDTRRVECQGPNDDV